MENHVHVKRKGCTCKLETMYMLLKIDRYLWISL